METNYFTRQCMLRLGVELFFHDLKRDVKQSWRKGSTLVTRGFEINRNVRGHERLEVIIDRGFYNLRIHNITEYDYSTYWCDTQHGNSITTEGTRLIHLDILVSFQSTLSNSPTSDTGIGQSFYFGLFATGFVVVCLSVGCNCFINKLKVAIAKRKERSSDDKEHQDVLHGNGTNNDATYGIALGEDENVFPHYELIEENEMIEMSHSTTSVNWPNFPCASNIVQSLQPKTDILEDINIQR
ncbi:unnamed protein product [Mytilus coruscus]|uniref:Immunoglobulin V-set domain-containing protein n=1 Tax=Mytilus coruscus TaxID=42192 RepID=A0A6J8EEX3_MYTCO|nr:unnamed protein product [Mytilus coruscus]